MSDIDWSNPMALSLLGVLVLMLAVSCVALIPIIIRGLLRLAVLVIIVIYILQYTALIRPLLPSFQEIGAKTVHTTRQVTKKGKAYLNKSPLTKTPTNKDT